jgi:DNA-binding response OmpR family regulator
MKVLVVDDDNDMLGGLCNIFQDAGFKVSTANNAEDALAIAAGGRPDVLITDLELGPGMDGIDLGVEARRRWPHLPIVYISGRPWLMSRHPLRAGEAFIMKPFRRAELLGEVGGVVVVRT